MSNAVKALLKKAYFSPKFNKLAVRLYSAIYPPPYKRPNMEFEYDVWNGSCTLHAFDGRQIGENNTNPEMYREVIDTEHKPCKYAGTRYGMDINLTALRTVTSVWDDTYQISTMMRNIHIERVKLTDKRFNLRQGYAFSKVATAYASYCARRKNNPIPVMQHLEAVMFTLGVGPFMVVRALMEKGDLLVLDPNPHDAETLYAVTDGSGSLVSAARWGCAGSPKLIRDFVDMVMNGTYAKELNSTLAKNMLAGIDDWDRYYDYSYATARLELHVKLAQALTAQALFALQSDLVHLDPAAQDLVKQSLDSLFLRPEIGTPIEIDNRTINANFIQIVLGLLDELNFPQGEKLLTDAGLYGPGRIDAQANLQGRSSDEIRRIAAKKIRQSMELLFPYCRTELDNTHKALQRFEGETISLDDMFKRCGGRHIRPLLAMLER